MKYKPFEYVEYYIGQYALKRVYETQTPHYFPFKFSSPEK